MRDRLENELREALRRQDPPPGFAERVLAAAEGAQAAPRAGLLETVRAWFRGPAARWAAAVCAMLLVGVAVEQRREHEKGEQAKAQLMLALRITGAKLSLAQAKVSEIGTQRRHSTPPWEKHL